MSLKAKPTRVENAYERLKREIMCGELPAGYQAPEPVVAERLAMSRTPVREALIRLEAEKLVTLIPRRGAKVLPICRQDLCDVCDVLAVLEALAAENAARGERGEGLLRDSEDVVEELGTGVPGDRLENRAEREDRFFRAIARAGGNPRLEAEIGRLLDQIFRASLVLLHSSPVSASAFQGHRNLVEAIREGRVEAAGAAARSLRAGVLDRLLEALDESGLTEV
ncbi:GntR family transcriptional regulator [Roseibium aggregatum]|uniref:GntR family transcriptional regulator n=1 Tax=Roseibium aggregatum TaxID=187304 RepID=A0A939EHS0_9HYPH|nr:GntR family transcriptional regulator [Roseibium aggregatum]MBN9671784.1 GntR family transcriptional regulator [Roseibium aggregatum]